MITPEEKRQIVTSLRSRVCPACGQKKQSRQTFCRFCYHALPAEMKRALYRRVGDGYEQAFWDALLALEVESPKWAP